MSSFPKFVIEDGNLVLAKCKFHKQIVIDPTKVAGGGWFSYNRDQNSFTLHGSSHDFGMAKLEDIQKCVSDNKVYSNSRLTRKLEGFTFLYRNLSNTITKLN